MPLNRGVVGDILGRDMIIACDNDMSMLLHHPKKKPMSNTISSSYAKAAAAAESTCREKINLEK